MTGRWASAGRSARLPAGRVKRAVAAARRRGLAAACTVIALSLLVAGCTTFAGFASKPPSRLYALDVSTVPATRAQCAVRFAIRELRLAAHLERPEVVLAREGSRIVAEPTDLWAGPLAQQLRRELSRALTARLDGSQAAPHPWRVDETPQLALAIEVDRLEEASGALQSSVSWRVIEVASNRQLASERWDNRRSIDKAPLATNGTNASAVVQAIDAALADLADVLAKRIATDAAIAGRWCGAR